MAPLPVIAGVVRCQVSGQMPVGGRWTNTIHVGGATTWDEATRSRIATFLDALYVTAGSPWRTTSPNDGTVTGYVLTPLDGQTPSVAFTRTAAGQQPATGLPAQTAIICTHYTGRRGKVGRGRTFFSPVATDHNDADGRVTSTVRGTIDAGWTAARATLDPQFMVIASYSLAQAFQVIQTVTQPYFAHQTSRRR